MTAEHQAAIAAARERNPAVVAEWEAAALEGAELQLCFAGCFKSRDAADIAAMAKTLRKNVLRIALRFARSKDALDLELRNAPRIIGVRQ